MAGLSATKAEAGISMSISSVLTAAPAIQFHLDLFAVDRDVLGDHRQNLFLQRGDQIGMAAEGALMRQQYLQAVARDRGGIVRPGKEAE